MILVLLIYQYNFIKIPSYLDIQTKIIYKEKTENTYYYQIKYNSYLYCFYSKNSYNVNDIIKISGTVEKYRRMTVLNGTDYFSLELGKNVLGRVSVNNISVVKHNSSIESYARIIINDKDVLLQSFIRRFFTGEKMNSELNDKVTSLQLFTFLSLSGIYIKYLLSLSNRLLYYITGSKKIKCITHIFILMLLFFLSKNNMVVKRYLVVEILIFINLMLKLYLTKLDIVSISFVLILVFNPYYFYNTNFYISYIFLFLYYLLDLDSKNKKTFFNTIKINILFYIFTFPFYSQSYTNINILSLIVGAFMIVFLSKITFYMVLLSIFFSFLDKYLLVYFTLLDNILDILSKVSININIPYIVNFLQAFYYVLLLLIIFIPKKRLKYIVTALSVVIFSVSINLSLILADGVYFLDVGQGDGCVVVKEGKVMVIDCFSSTYTFLVRNNIRQIEYLVLTHSDIDHTKDAKTITSNIKVKTVVTSAYSYNYNLNTNSLKLSSDDSFIFNKTVINILAPTLKNKENNDNSLVLQFVINNKTFLFCGDISTQIETLLVSKYKESLKSDYLKVAHHGSSTSTSNYFLDYVSPSVCFISCGVNNFYSHPSNITLDNLRFHNVTIYVSSKNGGLTILKNRKINYKPY
ncbi:MAG: ComEC/Rec2 family competence protein [Acholeplasmatales bacterium]|nr:ComEC/Rec2 family competence protein [Acholeplasmatales bacterium]